MKQIHKFLFVSLLLIVMISPIPYGSNIPPAWSLLSLLTGIIMLLWSVNAVSNRSIITVPVAKIAFIALPFIACLLWCIAQMVIPAALFSSSVNQSVWQETTQILGVDSSAVISLNPGRTLESIMRLSMYAGIFWLSLQFCRLPGNSQRLFFFIAVGGVLYSLYGLLMYFTKTEKVLTYDKIMYLGSLTSTFINRNSFATYAGLCLISSFALFFNGFFARASDTRSFIAKMLVFISTRGLIYIQFIAVILCALGLSNSRAGLACSLAAVFVFIILLPFSPVFRKGKLYVIAGLFLFLAATGYMVNSYMNREVIQRMTWADDDMGFRLQIYKETVVAIRQYPLTGSGLGTFEDVYRTQQNTQSTADKRIDGRLKEAHNTYLENALELGLPAFGLLMLSFASMVCLCLKGLFIRRSNIVFPVAGIAATALVGLHALVDFSMQIPAVAITYFAIMGACCAESWSSQKEAA